MGLKPIESYNPLQWADAVPNDDPESEPAPAADHPAHRSESVTAGNFVTFALQESGALDETRFNQTINQLPWEVFRIKGPVQFSDRTVMINYVGGKMEILPWDRSTATQLVFIGWDVEADQILAQFRQCVVGDG